MTIVVITYSNWLYYTLTFMYFSALCLAMRIIKIERENENIKRKHFGIKIIHNLKTTQMGGGGELGEKSEGIFCEGKRILMDETAVC